MKDLISEKHEIFRLQKSYYINKNKFYEMMKDDSMNPWLQVPYEDYAMHMRADDVYQLQTLNLIFKTHLIKYNPKSVLVLGCTGGNGFEHINDDVTKIVVGIDINDKYLDICKNLYKDKNYILDLRCMDINTEDILLNDVDFISCALLLEYVNIELVLNKLKNIMNKSSRLNIVIQRNNNQKFVSNTGIKSLNGLEVLCKEVEEHSLENLLLLLKYKIECKDIYTLPNGKEFISYICQC